MTDRSSLADIATRVRQPDQLVRDPLGTIDGDLVILGAAGTMGVSLSRMAAGGLADLPGDRKVYAVSRFSDPKARSELEDDGIIHPRVTLTQMLDWTVDWLTSGGELLDKPTHLTERTGKF